MTSTLIIPGLRSSGPAHWQSWFETQIVSTVRVIQPDWTTPDLNAWSARIRRDITRTPGRLYIVAHSFGALAAVQAANNHATRIAGALLVAPADPDKFGVSSLLPHDPLPFPTVVVGSTNDPWMSLQKAADWADGLGAEFVNLGAAGHINVDSGFGPWPEGLQLLERLRRTVARHDARERSAAARAVVKRRVRSRFDRHSEERRTLQQAAALLTTAGWRVLPPNRAETVVTQHRQ
ncbi:MAG: alpha/beta hydrolase [Hyphomicrobium sp.]|nr:alpha/beta hydrolase [Hyphomicrobium sp.]